MKRFALLLFLPVLLLSCFTRRTTISLENPDPSEQVHLVVSDFSISVNRSGYAGYLKQKIPGAAVDSLTGYDTIQLRSLPDRKLRPELYTESSFFIMQELNNGKAAVTRLSNHKSLKRVKRVTRYYKQDAITRSGVSSVFYYSGRKEIVFGKRYARICF